MSVSQRKRLMICSMATLVCTFGAAVGLYLALTRGYDPSIRHFAGGSAGAILAMCLSLGGIGIGILAAILLRREKDASVGHPGPLTTFAAIVTAFMLLAVFMLSFRDLARAETLVQIRILLTALSTLYFFTVTSEKVSAMPLFSFFSLLPILYAVFSILCTYFDNSYGMNAPVKTYALMMYVAMALFFTAEARCALGIPRPPLYAMYGIACVTMCLVNGISHSMVALNNTVGHGFALVESAAWVCIGLYALCRLLEFGRTESVEETANE